MPFLPTATATRARHRDIFTPDAYVATYEALLLDASPNIFREMDIILRRHNTRRYLRSSL